MKKSCPVIGSFVSFLAVLLLVGTDLAAPSKAVCVENDYMLELTATEVMEALNKGEFTSVEYVSVVLKHIEKHEKKLNTFIYYNSEQVLAQARQLDEERARGMIRGALHGLPVALKDAIHTAPLTIGSQTYPMPTTMGSNNALGNLNDQPLYNAEIVQDLLDAGAIILGKNNMEEYGMSVYTHNYFFGPARNPYDKDRLCGGSSGGTAASIGSRMVTSGVGHDAGGSSRIPAYACGVVGFRPTLDRYPLEDMNHPSDPGTESLPSFAITGPIGRSVKDISLIDTVMLRGKKSPKELEPANLKGLRLGVPEDFFYENLNADIDSAIRATLTKLENAGVNLVYVSFPSSTVDAMIGNFYTIFATDFFQDLEEYHQQHETGLTVQDVADNACPWVKDFFNKYIYLTQQPYWPDLYDAALSGRKIWKEVYKAYFRENNLDAMIIPAHAGTMIRVNELPLIQASNGEWVVDISSGLHRELHINMKHTCMAEAPSLCLPIGISPITGMPIGALIDGPLGKDQRILEIGLAIENLLGRLPPPKLKP